MSTSVKEFIQYDEDVTTVYRTDAVKWALSREGEANRPYLTMTTEVEAVLAVALNIDDEGLDVVLVDEGNHLDAVGDLDRAIAALTRARDRLSKLI